MMILNCKQRAANYSLYHDLTNRVKRRLRLSSYIFDEEGLRDELEPTTMSQVMISHEEEVSAQSFGDPSDEELEEWTKVLNNKADDEQ